MALVGTAGVVGVPSFIVHTGPLSLYDCPPSPLWQLKN